MKRMWMLMLMLALLAPASALAGGEMLLLELPQDAQMVEHIEFDDGDLITTYQLGGGGSVQLLRYAGFDMTVEELADSEYPGSREGLALAVGDLGGCPTQSLRFLYREEGQAALDVTLICVRAGEATLIFKAALPQAADDAQREALLQGMISSMDVSSEGEETIDETAEVG